MIGGLRALLAVLVLTAGVAAQVWDVVVYGGTSAGVTAAVQARRMGRTAVIVSPTRRLGGLSSSGLGQTDSGKQEVIGGLAREFYRRVKKHYDDPSAWRFEERARYRWYRADADAMWRFEPHVAERLFEELVAEAQVVVLRGEGLVDLRRDRRRIDALVLASGAVVRGRMFVDATYEGDLLARAGVPFATGREANARYNETLNGIQTARTIHHQFTANVDPYVTPGDPSSGLLPGITSGPLPPDGTGDHRIQAYNIRMCLTDVEANRIPFTKPERYDPRDFELLLRNFEAGDHRLPAWFGMMPNRKTDLNNRYAVSTDWIGMNWDYPHLDPAGRAAFDRRLRDYTLGLLWTLAYHERTPAKVREEFARWGLAKDEFAGNGHVPTTVYIREARRMIGEYVMSERDVRRQRPVEDSVGMGSYNIDSHNCQRHVTAEGFVRNEGDVQVPPGGPYPISWRSLLAPPEACPNLLVPVCVSASHIAYGSIRMEPVFMILGQSAATGACLALDLGLPLYRLPYSVLEGRLEEDGQVLRAP